MITITFSALFYSIRNALSCLFETILREMHWKWVTIDLKYASAFEYFCIFLVKRQISKHYEILQRISKITKLICQQN